MRNPSKIDSALSVIDATRAKESSCIVMMSLGKDSIVALDLLYPKYDRIVCVFMYFVKGLGHIQRWIDWVKAKYPRVEFVQVPHWCLTHILRAGLFCPAHPGVKLMKLADVVKSLRLQYGIFHVYLGMKKSDGMNRNLMLKGFEGANYINNGYVYPLAEWNQRDVLWYMKTKRLPAPVRYSLKASSGVGFNAECLLWMEKHWPEDLAMMYRAFPLCEHLVVQHKAREDAKSIDIEGENAVESSTDADDSARHTI